MRAVQDKYEAMLHQAQLEKGEITKKSKAMEDAMKYEVDYFKKELERVSKGISAAPKQDT